MKKYYVLMLLGVCLMTSLLQSCGDAEKEGETNEEGGAGLANWQDTETMMWAIDRYVKKEVFAKGFPFIPYEDNIAGIYWQLTPIALTNEVYPTGTETGYFTNIAITPGNDTALIDFKLMWMPEMKNSKGGKGDFVVEEVHLRKIGNVDRYVWKKDGKYYDKFPVKNYDEEVKKFLTRNNQKQDNATLPSNGGEAKIDPSKKPKREVNPEDVVKGGIKGEVGEADNKK
jgi:hypothetical protein